MGPITLFDKSFLQSLSVDESIWFDNFFYPAICPIFYVETLSDLKKPKLSRSPEQEVGIIADKFPEMHCAPIPHHARLAIYDLLGRHVPLTGQIPRFFSRQVKSGKHKGVVYEQSPEEEAFLRWQSREFDAIEHEIASDWRENLKSHDLEEITDEFRKLGISEFNCKSLQEAKSIADNFVNKNDKTLEMLEIVFLVLDIPEEGRNSIMEHWSKSNHLPLSIFAPYAAHVLTVDALFHIALASSLISPNRPSNRVDMAYLYYLPFSMVFVSSDRLHRQCAPLLARENQSFIWGQDLKKALSCLDKHYCDLRESVKEKGVMQIAPYPPTEIETIVSEAWDKHFPGWRENAQKPRVQPDSNPELVKELKNLNQAPPLQPDAVDFKPEDADVMSVRRRVHKRKGNWWQLPRDLDAKGGEGG